VSCQSAAVAALCTVFFVLARRRWLQEADCCVVVYGLVQFQARPEPLVLDVIGSGEDLEAIQEYAAEKKLNWRWLGGKDHADPSMHDYQVNYC